jgi:hypothetical protein
MLNSAAFIGFPPSLCFGAASRRGKKGSHRRPVSRDFRRRLAFARQAGGQEMLKFRKKRKNRIPMF